ncbi:MAG TPA: hypothetical protein VGL20_21620 [Candidatus Dormibacteraeota bacterium]
MPSRTVVYGVGAATGILVGVVIAQLNRTTSRERLQRLLGRGPADAAVPTHIVLPDLEPVPAGELAGDALPDGRGAERTPVTPT